MRKSQFLFFAIFLIFLVSCSPQATPTTLPVAIFTEQPEPTNTPTATVTSPIPTNTVPIPTQSPPAPTATSQVVHTACPTGWPQLQIDGLAKVSGTETDPPNRVRAEPTKNSEVIAQIYPGTIVKVLEGPVCADGLVFWNVEHTSIPGGAGWTAEGDGTEYWLEVYRNVRQEVQLAAYGVSFTVPGSWSDIPQAEIVRAGSNDLCKWPEHIKIMLTNYPAQSEWKPTIYVYLTKKQPDWYPLCPGAPLLRVKTQQLTRGERVLIGSKNARPIFNSDFSYAYKGTTPDGEYTVFAFMPVNFPLLAYSFKNPALPPGGIPFNLETQNWEDYYGAVGKQLEAASDSDFTPNLEILDAFVESIRMDAP